MDSKESIQPLCAYDSTPSVYWGYRVFSKGQRVKEGSESERGRYVTHFVVVKVMAEWAQASQIAQRTQILILSAGTESSLLRQ